MDEPVILRPGEGETISDSPKRVTRIKVTTDDLTVTDNRYAEGESGPDSHVHREHCDCFYLYGGELTFVVGKEDQAVKAGEGTWVMVPPGLVHTFRNDGPADACFLNVHAPSRGFGEHLQAMRDASTDEEREAAAARFDSEDPPPDGGLPATVAIVRGPGDGEDVSLPPARILLKAGGDDPGGGPVGVAEIELPPGFPGPVPHRLPGHTYSFYSLEGALSLHIDGERVELPEGGFTWVPPQTARAFPNETEATQRALHLITPGGFEQHWREMADAFPPGTDPDPGKMIEIAGRYGFEPVT
jgi:quercetin dioxygenase-like cupin family protein